MEECWPSRTARKGGHKARQEAVNPVSVLTMRLHNCRFCYCVRDRANDEVIAWTEPRLDLTWFIADGRVQVKTKFSAYVPSLTFAAADDAVSQLSRAGVRT